MVTTLVALLSIAVTGLIFAVGSWAKTLSDNRTLRATIESLTSTINEMKIGQLVTNEVMKAVKQATIEKAGG